jgi:hypothetical protein
MREAQRADTAKNEAPLELTSAQIAAPAAAENLTLAEAFEREWPMDSKQS